MKDFFSFAEEVPSFDSTHCKASFDIEFLFINIPSKGTMNICDDKLFHNKTKTNNLSKESFKCKIEVK